MANKEYKTIKYFKAEQLQKQGIEKSDQAEGVISMSSEGDNIAVVLSVTNPIKIEKAVNITSGGFDKIRELVPIS